MYIHIPSGIRTHNLSMQAAVDLSLRPRGYWGRQIKVSATEMNIRSRIVVWLVILRYLPDAQMAERQFLQSELTWNVEVWTIRLGIRRLMMSVEDGQASDPRKTLMTNITYWEFSEFRSSQIIASKKKIK